MSCFLLESRDTTQLKRHVQPNNIILQYDAICRLSYIIMSDYVDAKPGVKEIEKAVEDDVEKKDVENSLDADTGESREPERPSFNLPLYYNMNYPIRGRAIIFSHKNFDKETGQRTRDGTHFDVEKITTTFEKTLEFEVENFEDLTDKKIDGVLKDIQEFDFSNYGCLFLFILSHGDLLKNVKKGTSHRNSSQESCEEMVLWAKNDHYNPNKIFEALTPDKCPTLIGKPKVLIIQSCRGDGVDDGLSAEANYYTEVDGHGVFSKSAKKNLTTITCRLPLYTDFLCAWSTLHGLYSYRSPITGSYFIQALCNTIEKHNDHLISFCDILCIVNGLVAKFESSNKEFKEIDGKKQTSTFTSQLIKILSFSSKIDSRFVDDAKITAKACGDTS